MADAGTGMPYWRRRRLIGRFGFFYHFDHILLWYTHVVQAVVVFNKLVVEPRAVASFPRFGAYHAELSTATAGHMVATLLQLDKSITVVTTLPAPVFCHLHDTLRLWVLGALSPRVEFTVA
jgi:hypothetical protein